MTYQRIKDYWLPVLASQDLKSKPVKVTYDGTPVVLFRADGQAQALVDRCPHRGAALSAGRVQNNLIVCPYHGWSFDGSGQCQMIPGRCSEAKNVKAAEALPVSEFSGFVWMGPTEAEKPYISPYLDRSVYDCFTWSLELQGDLIDVVENFLDATHTHHVHAGLIRSEGARSQVTVEVTRQGDQCQATYHGEEKSTGLISKLFEGVRTTSTGRFALPAVAEIEYRSKKRVEFGMTAYLTPKIDDIYNVFVTTATPKGIVPGGLKKFVLSPFLKTALEQDRKILDNQRENLARFPDHQHSSTELDVLRPHILKLLKHGPSEESFQRMVEMKL